MKKVNYAIFWIGMLGVVLAFFGKLSSLGIWVVAGIFSIFIVLITIRAIYKKGAMPMFIALAIILTIQDSKAQTFEELQQLSNENTSVLKEIKTGESGQYGAIKIAQDEGSAGYWLEITAPRFHFSGYKEIITGVQGSQEFSPAVLIGKVSENISLLLIRRFTTGFISGEKNLYLIDSMKNSSQELFIPGYIAKIFEKEGLIFVESQVGGYHSPVYTQVYTIISLRGETVISSSYQREVESEINK